jgi:ethanolamine utilization protein EutQ (cupin superfamily)
MARLFQMTETMNTANSILGPRLRQFKQHLQEQGFVSPVLGELEPMYAVPKSTNRQEIFGLVLEGDLLVKSEDAVNTYLTGELFFISKVSNFEIQAGPMGVKYLFAFKQATLKVAAGC